MANKRFLVMATAFLLLIPLTLVMLLAPPVGSAAPAPPVTEGAECGGACHQDKVDKWQSGMHAGFDCLTCHEGATEHLGAPNDPLKYPRYHFDQELCLGCHKDQYDTFEIVSRGKTFYGGSDPGATPPKGWSKTWDLPYWNLLIDGHPFVLETYEDSPMAVNQIEHQETIRPGSEACMECHGTRAAFMMGIQYKDKNGVVHTIPEQTMSYTLPNGTVVDIPAKEYTVKYTPSNRTDGHIIYDGTSYLDAATGEWTEAVNAIVIPVGTKAWSYTDGVNLSGGPYAQKYQVKTLVTLPYSVTVDVIDKFGAVTGTVTFDTIATYPEAGADINGMTGFSPPALPDGNVATVARNWIYSTLEAIAFDGLDYYFDDPAGHTTFHGGGPNWPSIASGELCNQCHDPHSGQMRIVKKSLIAAIAERGINPYSPTGQNVLDFEQGTRQDKVIALCAQCHSEYVGGYSANTKLDQDYFPWAKPADLETQYNDLFGYLQDWTHGGPVVPWQAEESNARGFTPYDQRYVIGAPLVKVQHPEAEAFLNSPMYIAGATCTDCHAYRVTRPDGTRYTSHWFASPLKLMDGFTGTTYTGETVSLPPQNPCVVCHTTDTTAQSRQRIMDVQNIYFQVQEQTQVALVNALKYIKEQQDQGIDQGANIKTYQQASMRWEYYTQAENSMGFHNRPEATTEVANARLWVDAFVPWPLTPVQVRITSTGATNLTLTFYDQATDETGFVVERATALAGPYTKVADIPTPTGANIGDVQFTDVNLASGTTYFYRVAAYNAAGISVWSIWAEGLTLGVAVPAPTSLVATPVSSSRIDISWTDNATDETGFHIERARNVTFTQELAAFDVAANVTTFGDSELQPGTTYYYRVFTVRGADTSAPSNTASATTLAAPPAAPTNLVITGVGMNYISLRWRDNANTEDGYYVERSTNGGTTWTRIATLAPNTISFTNTGLIRYRYYWYRVQAFNLSGPSAYSNVVVARTR